MKILKMQALVIHLVQVRRLDHLVAIAPKITITLVIGKNDDDVRPLAGEL